MKSKERRVVGVDTLRFFAVTLIVIYHCFPSFLPSGFLAVEIFFAISGFFICQKLLNTLTKRKHDLGTFKGFLLFFKNRLVRFLPTLLFAVILSLTIAYFANPDLLTGARENTLYATTFSTNIANLLRNSTYENSLIPNLFNHTWFLALELQLCLIFYVIFSSFYKIARLKNLKKSRARFALFFSFFCLFLGIISYLLMYVYADWLGLRDRAYFGPDSHAGAFLLGSALSCLLYYKNTAPSPARKSRVVESLLLIISCGLIIFLSAVLSYSHTTAFALNLSLTAILSILILFLITKLQPASKTPAKKPPFLLKILKPFECLGKISFPIYLLHYPLFLLLPDLLKSIPLNFVPFIAILISIILSIIFDKLILPFSKKHRKIFFFIFFLGLILPILSLVKAPETSSIEENLNAEKALNKKEEPKPAESTTKIDYSNAEALTPALEKTLNYMSASKKFAKPYPVYVQAAGSYSSSGRATWNTPNLSNISALAKSRVLVIGDSVVLGATSAIYNTIPGAYVDAMGSRNMADAINLLSSYRAANGGNLPYIIVIGLVTNYYAFNFGTLQTIVDVAGPSHQFVFMTGYCGDYPREAQNNTIKSFAASYGNVHVGDWYPIAAANVYSYTYADHIHLTPAGRSAYANLISQKVSGL